MHIGSFRYILFVIFGIIFGGALLWGMYATYIDTSYQYNSPYWNREGVFIYTGSLLSADDSLHFFTGENSIIQYDIRHSGTSALPSDQSLRYYIEMPVFLKDADSRMNHWIHAHMQKVSKGAQVGTGSLQGKFPELSVYSILHSGNGVGGIELIAEDNVSSPDNTEFVRQIFLRDMRGKWIQPQELLRFKTDADKHIFIQILSKALEKQDINMIHSEEFTRGIHAFFESPQFLFSDKDIILFLNRAITLRIPYREVAKFIMLSPRAPESKGKATALQSLDGKKYVALTFDDGPNNTTTPKLLDILQDKKVHATFFVLGKNAERFPEVLKRTHREGHEIANHSWDHPRLPKLSEEEIVHQIEHTNRAIKQAIGVLPDLLRPPYGEFNDTVRNIATMPIIMWSIDSMDWKNRNVGKNLKKVAGTKEGDIILFHDIHAPSVETIPLLIDDLRKKGFEFVTVSDLYKKYYFTSMSPFVVCYSMRNCRWTEQ